MGAYNRRGKKRHSNTPRSYVSTEMKNDLFEQHYKGKIISNEEWDEFIGKLREPLPVTFRISAAEYHQRFEKYLEDRFSSFLERIEWYPGTAYKVSAGRTQVRREERYAELHTLLVRETEAGSICRQEAVSMIPPLFLNVSPGESVLDMCAAPGSKTCQLLEALRDPVSEIEAKNSSKSGTTIEDQKPSDVNLKRFAGMVVANDVDTARASMMIHQVKRMHSPQLVVTTTDASQFPLKTCFTKILCDVPCSGDGTLRKNKLIWNTWHPRHAEALQPLQVSILVRGLRLLASGGRLVYSTCSMNSVENEEVVEKALLQLPLDAYKLVDCSTMFPGLRRREGLPLSSGLSMEHCMRFYPHLQDTGGFFVALFERITEEQLDRAEKQAKHGDINGLFGEEDMKKWNPDKDKQMVLVEEVKLEAKGMIACRQWEIDETIAPLLIVRNEENHTFPNLSLISSEAKKFVVDHPSITLYAGMQAFVRQDEDGGYRIRNPALPYLLPLINREKKRIVTIISSEDIYLLLSNVDPHAVHMELLSTELQEHLSSLEIGSHVAQLASFAAVPLWRGRASVNVLVNKIEKASLLFHWNLSST